MGDVIDPIRLTASARRQVRGAWLALRLLCRRGVGLSNVAPELCRLIRQIVPADAAAICWIDEAGNPTGFYHENPDPRVLELFANHYEELFAGPGEYGVAWMMSQRGRTVGNWLAVTDEVEMSNTYNLWMRPAGHRHLLEARIEVGGCPTALLTLYREPQRPFAERDVSMLSLIEPLMQRAATPDETIDWASDTGAVEHLLVNEDGTALLSRSPGADEMLQGARLIGQGVSLLGALATPPALVRDLCRQVASGDPSAVFAPAGNGRLRATARPMMATGTADHQVLIDMRIERPSSVAVLQTILDLRLSPLRSEILQYAVTGGRRDTVAAEFGISKESVKKHVGEIYRATGARDWDELRETLTRV